MDVILVIAYLFKFHIVSLCDFLRYLGDGERDFTSQQRLSVLHGKNNVIMHVIHVVLCPKERHASILCENRGFHTFLQGVAAEPRGILVEDIEGMFNIYHKGTRNFFEGYSNLNAKDIENAEWLCDTKKLKELVDSQTSEIAFYCGVSSDIDELLPFLIRYLFLKQMQKHLMRG